MKYKVGDKVKVKSLEWYNENKNNHGRIYTSNNVIFQPNMSEFCGSILTIKNINIDMSTYVVEENSYHWTDEMFEGLAKEWIYDEDDIGPLHEVCQSKLSAVIIDSDVFKDEVELILNDYKVVTHGDKTYAVKKKPKYPKNYEECCEVLGMTYDYPDIRMVSIDECSFYSNFIRLIRCRDAYWKIAGEQMGLGKSWEPEYISLVNNEYFTIHTFNNEIIKSGTSHRNAILAFPTEEMRDKFFENFKELIERCKKLL